MPKNRIELKGKSMQVILDKTKGTIWSIQQRQGKFDTNFVANEENVEKISATPNWTGDIIATVWKLPRDEQDTTKLEDVAAFQSKGNWQPEWTSFSKDIRKVNYKDGKVNVTYSGKSKQQGGIKSFGLKMTYTLEKKDSLLWEIEITNTTKSLLEIGELGLPLAANNDYRGVYKGKSPLEQTRSGKYGLMQKLIHEEKVLCHHFAAGHSSYSLLQRPLGNAPFLLVHFAGDTAIECIYHTEGRDILALYSWATKKLKGWHNDWVNGHTSLLLKPAETRKFQVRFSFVKGYSDIRKKVYDSNNLGIRIIPSMVVQEDTPVYVEIQSKKAIDKVEFLADNITISKEEQLHDKKLLTLQFKKRGQKTIRLNYEKNRWTNLHFYCVENLEQLIKARSRFITERQFYDNPPDPYNRHHMFLPFDYNKQSPMYDSDEVWEVGGSDEFGFSEPLYLAEKNLYYPSKKEVETLETYVDDCLFKHIQNPETYEVRASLFWKNRYPSSPWGHWPEERSGQLWRTYNYPHPANIYHDLYQIGTKYGLLTRRQPLEYLKMCYHTCMKWFTTGNWPHIGLMCGSNAINILEDLRKEGWESEYSNLLQVMKKCNQVFVEDPYPYGSELFIDQTAHEQVYFFTRYFGNTQKNLKTLQVIKALRGGDQPAWFQYGNDKRGEMACWYSESLNGWALLRGFEDTGDLEMFMKGYAGVMSITANLLPDGMGFGWFIYAPGIFANQPPRTLDNGIATYGFFKAIKSYVMNIPPFGLIGCGCKVESLNNKISVEPVDGLRKRVLFIDKKIELIATKGEILNITLDQATSELEIQLTDSTGFVDQVEISISGLDAGKYEVKLGNTLQIREQIYELKLEVPIDDASLIRVKKINQD